MTPDEERELADLLRRALREEAARHIPAGDGLSLIQRRVQTRGRFAWARPVLVMGAVIAVAAAAAVLPGTLRSHPGPPSNTAAGTAASPPAATRTPPPTTPPTTATRTPGTVTIEATGAPSVTLPPGAGVADMRTVWPYGSRAQAYYQAEADVRSGKLPELTDASAAAVSFVRRFVGSTVKLAPGPTEKINSGLGVVVYRLLGDGSEHPVTRVYLVRVSTNPKAPWLVASADRPSLTHLIGKDPSALNELTLSAQDEPLVAGTDQIAVSGSVHRPITIATASTPTQVKVELCDVNGSPLSFNLAYARDQVDGATFTWHTAINIEPADLPKAASIVAWTLDGNSDVLEFVARPTTP